MGAFLMGVIFATVVFLILDQPADRYCGNPAKDNVVATDNVTERK